MLSLKWPVCISVTAGLAAVAFAGFAAKTTPANVVLAKNTVINLPSQPGKLKEINPQLIAQKQPKVALVIGNANYEEDRLSNPVNDATDIAKALKELGFEVTFLQNQDLRSMEAAIDDFSRQLRKGGVGVFYYAGHGVQVEGENYLIPLKAKLLNEKDARYEAVALGKVLNAMEEARNQVNIIIIDACRDNPFYRRWRSSRRSSNVRGLTAVSPPSGIIIAYATREGNTAADGQGQRNSPFTSALLENIKKPNIDVQLMFRRVSTAVKQKT
ncbi:MAG: caspase domain-containing protein, partial [Microcystis aeruginosa]